MIKKIKIILEYKTYPLWLYNQNDEVIDNDNPPEWNDDNSLTKAFLELSHLYDSFFIESPNEFKYVGPPNQKTSELFVDLYKNAMSILYKKNSDKYLIQDDNDLHLILNNFVSE